MTCESNVCTVPGCSGEWALEVAAAVADLRFGGGLAVDSQGTVHAALSHGGYYAKKPAGGAWSLTPTGNGGWNAALALEKNGAIHISSFDNATGNVNVSSRAAGATTWTNGVAGNAGSGQFQDTTSIVADGAGGLHVRYLKDGTLAYAHRAPGATTWTNETAAPQAMVAGSTADASNTLAVDAAGGVHIVYFDTFTSVSYAHRAPAGGWTNEVLSPDGSMTAPAWLATDAAGGVHALYLAAISRQLRHSYKPAGGAWVERTLVTKLEQIFGPSLAVSDVGIVHVGYRNLDTLYYLQAPPTGTSLDFYNFIDGGSKVGEYARFALDIAGGVHAVYESQDSVKYAYRCPGACPAKSCSELGANCGTVFDGCKSTQCGTCSDPTLCGAGPTPNTCCVPTTCQAAGKECGSISDGCGKQIDCGGCALDEVCGSATANLCGACVPGKWTADVVSSLGNVGYPSALTVDPQNQPRVLFSDQTATDLVYAEWVGGSWQTSLVDGLNGASYAPFGISVVADAQGGLHAAYSVLYADTTVRYAYRAPTGTTWAMTDVATGLQNTLTRPVLRRDGSGGLHLAYYDGTQKAVIYAFRAASGGSWTKTLIANGGNQFAPGTLGEEVSMVLDGSSGVHLVYSVSNIQIALGYAYKPSGGSFSLTPIVSGSSLHANTSIALDASGGVHVAYSDFNALRHAYKPVAGSFSNEWVTNADYVDSSFMVDVFGTLHIVYNDDDSPQKDLMHGYKPVGAILWTTQPIDTVGDLGKLPSAVLDAAGGIHVAYSDFTQNDVKYAYRCPEL